MSDPQSNGKLAPFTIRPLSDKFAAEIIGLDLRQSLDAGTRQAIMDALVRYQVICFRDQCLSGEQQVAFTEQFGVLETFVAQNRGIDNPLPTLNIVTNLGKDGEPTGDLATRRWHTDKSFLPTPSFATILHPVILPPVGGETCFADMYAAYDALTDAEKAELANVRVVHSREFSLRSAGKQPTAQELEDAGPPMAHPLVRVHPESGRKGLFMGEHASHFEGQETAGRARLDQLEAHATQERFVYRHAWRKGDVLMWDNRCLLHRGDTNFDVGRHPRVLHRTCLSGTPSKRGHVASTNDRETVS
jgi:alpha-ketoglutarate-dependent taurine dioxygenase